MELRQQILDAAAQLFQAEGVNFTTGGGGAAHQ